MSITWHILIVTIIELIAFAIIARGAYLMWKNRNEKAESSPDQSVRP